jgi:hypothetical protein
MLIFKTSILPGLVSKDWLYQKRTQARLERHKAERRQRREEETARRKAEQSVLFEF